MTYRIATNALALSAAIAAPAFADVTAADVWSNQQGFYGAMGVTLSGSLVDGQLTAPELNVVLPEGAASMQIVTDDVMMTDNSNGTVTISYPSPMTISFAGGARGEAPFDGKMTMTHDGYTIIASGNPGDITYVADAQNLRLDFDSFNVNDPTTQTFDFDGYVAMAFWTGTTRVSEGNLITYASTSAIGRTIANFVSDIDNGRATNVQETESLNTTIAMSLPVGGVDLMNLSAELRDGLSIQIESETGASASISETTLNSESINRQAQRIGTQATTVALSEDGALLATDVDGFTMTLSDPLMFPGDLDFTVEKLTATYDVPLNASTDPQDFRIATSLQGLTLGEAIWDMIDATGQLPRDPAEVSFDVTGTGTNGTDLLDFVALSQMFGAPDIEVDQVTIQDLTIKILGVEALAQGAMTFDWTDFQTIPGLPRPEGAVTVNLNGVNALLDTAASMGLLPEDQLMIPRMMMGMFTTPVGDDMLETMLEVNSEGHVLANGQRIQ
jgi:hypothetical protein